MDPDKTTAARRGLFAVGETVLALASAIFLTIVVMVAVVALSNVSHTLRIVIEPAEQATISPEELADRLRALGTADEVRVDLENGNPVLVLSGADSAKDASAKARDVLEAAGYSPPTRIDTRRSLEMGRILERSGRLLLSLQALVFVAIAAVMVLFRVRPETPVVRTDARGTLLWGLLGGLVAFAASALIGLVLSLAGFPVEEQAWVLELFQDRKTVWKLAPWLILIVPVSEEVFFRGYMLRFLDQRAGRVAGVIISSALFALIHFNPSGIVVYFVIGLVLALLYLRTGRLWAPILAHMIHNGVVFAIGLAGFSS